MASLGLPRMHAHAEAQHNIQHIKDSDPRLWERLKPALDTLADGGRPPRAQQYTNNPDRFYLPINVPGRDETTVLCWKEEQRVTTIVAVAHN